MIALASMTMMPAAKPILSRVILPMDGVTGGEGLRLALVRGALLQELQHRRRLVEGLLVLVFEARVGHDAAAGPEADHAARVDQRADRDVQVHAAVEADVADGPAINPAALRLQLLDDLHRAQLGRPGDRSARERAAQQVERVADRKSTRLNSSH